MGVSSKMPRIPVALLPDNDLDFYPTPDSLIAKMLSGIDIGYTVQTILEPSAGKGDILRRLGFGSEKSYYRKSLDIDCIEIDPNLRQILKGIDNIHIVHDDFLTYQAFKQYDLIIMNPPFSNGDVHLLKALDMQKDGGQIVCILNAETIRNPYTERRKELVKKLNEYGAQIEYIQNAFSTAARKTNVEIALIRVKIERTVGESEIYNRMKEAEQVKEEYDVNVTDLAVTGFIKAAVAQFNVEVKSGLELIRTYKELVPHMRTGFDEEDPLGKDPILRLMNCHKENKWDALSINEFLKDVRYKYWKALLANPKFVGKLTTTLQEKYQKQVEKLSNYDFSEFNIYELATELNANVKSGIEEEIVKMFDRLTEEHTWYPECQKNRHLYTGWKTNKAHKIDKKVIIPCYGVFSSWYGSPDVYEARKTLEDIERILNFLDGGMTQNVDIGEQLKTAFDCGQTKNIELKYFKATFYKKGTVHLVFTNPELIDRFNIYAGQRKSWLPPSYGKKSYTNMTAEEKTVIDSFQGEESYNKVLENAGYYLRPVSNNQMLMLGSGE